MGIVRRQSIRVLAISYVGIVLGYINKVALFNIFLSPEQFGLIELLLGITVILSELATMGSANILIKFAPYFIGKREREGEFNFLMWMLPLIGSLCVILLILLLRGPAETYYGVKSPLFAEHYLWLIPFVFFFTYSTIAFNFLRTVLKTVIPVFIREVLLRLMQTVVILLYIPGWISFEQFLMAFIGTYLLQFAITLVYLLWLRKLRFRFSFGLMRRPVFRLISGYGLFSLLNNSSSLIVQRIDLAMIGLMLGLPEAGLYALATYVIALVQMPARSTSLIAAPIIARSWKSKDHDTIRDLYRKSALNNLLFGGILFILLFVHAESFSLFLKPEFKDIEWTIFFLGLGRIFDMANGVNGEILVTSKYFRMDLWSNLCLVGLTIFTNLLFIPAYGVAGAAMATSLSILAYNLFRTLFIWRTFRMQPFGKGSLLALLLLLLLFGLGALIPKMGGVFTDLTLRTALLGGLYLLLALGLRISPDLNGFAAMIADRLGMGGLARRLAP